MTAKTGRLRRILEREVAVHRELLRLARLRHVLLRQGRFAEAAELAVVEAAHLVTLRNLEAGRVRLGRPPVRGPVAARTAQQIAVMVRGLGAVERANRTLANNVGGWRLRVGGPPAGSDHAATAATPAAHAWLN